MKNFTQSFSKLFKSTKICLFFLGFMISGNTLLAQKVIIVGVNFSNNETRNDAVSFVVNIPLVNGESIFFTDNEYNAANNNFDGNLGGGGSPESILKFIANTNIAKGQVISLRFIPPSTTGDATPVTVACTGGVCGTASFINVATVSPSYRTIGESIYAYSDSDNDPMNGVTEIFSVFYASAETGANSTGGDIPGPESPISDFPNAVVVDGFTFAPGTIELHLLDFTASRTNVSKTIIELATNYTSSNNPASNPSTTVFTNLNLLGTNPALTLLASTTSIVENAAGTITYTFTLSANAASNITVNFTVGGTATFNTDYTQSGAVTFSTTAGTITIPSGSNTASFTIDPTGDASLEANETVIITAISDVGYDAGSPSVATATITNDDTNTAQPKVAISGINHGAVASDVESFSFAALEDITSGTIIYFTDNTFDKTLLKFTNDAKTVFQWTAPATVNRGDVYVVSEDTNGGTTFTLTCSDGSGCGSVAVTQGSGMSFGPNGTTFIAFSDSNTDPFSGTEPIVGQIHSVVYTGNSTVSGGQLLNNPSSVYPNVVITDNFPAVAPVRTEYKFATGERAVSINRSLFTNTSNTGNWVHAGNTQTVSTIRFTNITITNGVTLPLSSVNVSPSPVDENSGTGMVYTFTLSQNATSNITVNFAVTGTATFTTDYTQSGAASFTASTGSVVIPSGSNSASVTLTPVAETTLEPNETVVLTIDTGTGYDAGSPSVATGTITNDDVVNVNPLVVIVGVNHGTSPDPDGISFAANQNLTAGTEIYFTDSPYNNTTLNFSTIESITKYTVPAGGLAKGQVVYVVETGQLTNAFTVSCSAGANCGTFAFISGDFSLSANGEDLYAYTDNDADPTNGITAIHSLFYAINGAMLTTANPSSVYPNAVVVSGFGNSLPNRTEYKFASSERSAAINIVNIQNTANYLIAQTTQGLSVVPFAILSLCPASVATNPSNASIAAGSNTSFTVTATGSNLTYQWQVNTGSGFTNISNGGIYSGATSATLTLTNVPFANNGFTYQCVVNDCATSTAATLTVFQLPVISVVDASNVAITNGGAYSNANNTDFGLRCVTGATQSKTYTIKNTGQANLTLSGSPLAVLGGTDAGQFSITTQPTSPIAPGGSTTFTVLFDPNVGGPKNATITLTNNDATNSPYVINIHGTGGFEPTITLGASPAICAGATSFTIPFSNLNYTPTSYSVSGTGITTVTNQFFSGVPSPFVVNLSNPAAFGTNPAYSLTVTNGNTCTSGIYTGSVTVLEAPAATASSNSPVCAGSTINLTGGGVGTYAWAGPSFTSTDQNPSITNATTGATGIYTITVTNANLCTATATTSVTVNTVPTASPISNTPVCSGNTLSLTSTTATSYSWTGPNGFASTVQNPSISNVSILAGSAPYTLTVTNAGCTASATTSVTINSTAAPTSPTAMPSSITLSGNTTTLTASGCSSPSTITWYDLANSTVALPNNTPTISSNKTFFARCTGTNTCVSNPSANVVVTFNPCTSLGASPGNVNITWTGLLSTDWNTACNWNPAWVPDLTNNMVIIPNTTNDPIITGTVPDVKVIEIQTSALLTISSTGTLNVRGDGGVNKGIWLNKGNLTNNGNINIQSVGNTAIDAYIYLSTDFSNGATFTNNGIVTINSTDEAIGVGISANRPAIVNNNANGIINVINGIGVEVVAPSDILQFNNVGTFNYNGAELALKFLGTTTLTNTGIFNINSGRGIENPSGSTITNNACGKILMSAGTYTNGGTTTNAGLIQLPNTLNFTNTGTFTNNGVLKANTVASITNNKMVITNTCPIFTLGGTNNYTVSGIFTDAGATTSAGTYTSVGNKFTANNIIPTGSQTLFAQVTDGTCTFVVPFSFSNVKPTAVSVSNTTVCTGGSVTLSATCASGTLTWYTDETGGTSIGTGTSLSQSPTSTTTYYAACETTNCVSGRGATSEVTVSEFPFASANSNSPICAGSTLNLNSGSEGNTYLWTGPNSFTSTELSPSIANATVSATGTYMITITNASSCTATATVAVIVNPSLPPILTLTSASSVCSPSTLTLTASGCAGTVTWSQGAATGTSLTLSAVGTYSITATCSFNGCISDASSAVPNLEIKQTPIAPTIGATTSLVVCSPSTLNLTASGCAGTVTWSDNSTGNSLTLSTVGTYSITATCTVNGCPSPASTAVSGLEIKAKPSPPTITLTSAPSVCTPSTLNLTASACAGMVTWSLGGATGTSLSISAVGTYFITATCTVNGCTSNASTAVSGLEIKQTPAAPTIGATAPLIVCESSTLNLTASGCAGTVTWSQGGATGTSLTISAVGTYSITATCSFNGCPSGASNVVGGLEIKAKPSPPTITLTSAPSVCTTSTLNLTASACAGMVTWSLGGATGTSLSISAVGTYSITATCTVNGCTSNASTAVSGLEIKQTPAAPTIGATTSLIVCESSTLNLTASGCAGTVTWSQGGATGTSLTISAVGTYSITATCMVNGCLSGASNIVNGLEIKAKPAAPTIGATTPLVVCTPSTLNLTASACAGTVTWSQGGATGNSLTLSAVGTYSITATCTTNGCISDASLPVSGLEIKQTPVAPTIGATTSLVVCSPSTLNLTASGCAGTVTWSDNSTGNSLTISAVGTYSITATCMVNGCLSGASNIVNGLEIKAKPAAPTITPPSQLSVCSPSTLTLTASGCSGTVTWSQGGATGTSLTLSAVGTYLITATCTVNGCVSDASSAISGLEIKQTPPAPSIGLTTASVVCSPSTLNLTASGCAGTVTWSDNSTGNSLTISAVGTYSITAICTVNGCPSPASSAVSGLEIKAKPIPPTITLTTASSVCAPSTINLTASGCAGTVTWSQGGATGASLTLSAVGIYSITATCSTNGCISDASSAVSGLEIKQTPVAPTIGATTSLVVCSPSTLNLTASGCAGTVTWSNASTGNSLTISAVGTYSITATCMVNGCPSGASNIVNGLEIKAKPLAPTIGATTPLVVCTPSTLNLTASGCAGTVTWSQGSATGTSLTLSAVGTYSITATCTVNGCTSDASLPVSGLEIKQTPAAPTIGATTPLVVCSPSTLNLTASGCAGTVTWSDNSTGNSLTISAVGTYTITATCMVNGCPSGASNIVNGLEIKQTPVAPTIGATTPLVVCSPSTLNLTASGCAGTVTWSNASTGNSLTLSTVGTYSITATCMVNGCTSDASLPVSGLEIKQTPPTPTISAGTSTIFCNGGSVTLTSSSPTGNVWSTGAITQSIIVTTAGNYTVAVTSLGCTSGTSAGTIVTVNPLPTITTNSNSPQCAGNTLNLMASGGVSYSWTGTNGFASNAQNPSISNASPSNSGVYVVTVTDGNSCSATGSLNIIINALPIPTASSNSPICNGGTLNLFASGGSLYSWTGPSSFASTLQNPSILNTNLSNAGIYNVSVTDANGCSATTSTSVISSNLATATNTGPYVTNQTITLIGTGGSDYSWAGPNGFTATGANVNRPNALLNMGGIYTVTVTSGLCSNTATTNVVITGIDPCTQIMEYTYIKAGNPYQPLYSLFNGMTINQESFPTSIIVHPICNSIIIESVEMNLQGPNGVNVNIIQNVEPFAIFDNFGINVFGQTLAPGTYTLAVTGYSLDNKGGVVNYPTTNTTFTIVGSLAMINMPTYTGTEFCAGNTLPVTFSTSGTFNVGNVFKIQLSDATGDFTTPLEIGNTTTAGTINCTIPLSILFGENYRIRVVSTNTVTQNMNPAAVTIHPYIANLVSPADDYSTDKNRKAVYQINATNKVNSPAKVNYQSAGSIQLNAGFEAKAGTVFKAEIKSCPN